MKRERDLELRLQSLETLRQAVVAMKSLSAHHFRTAREALEPARAYRTGLDRILRSTGASLPAGSGPVGLVVVGGELGFCGSYNASVARAGIEYRKQHGPGPTACVGHRAATYLRRQGVSVDREYPAPTSVHGTTDTLLKLAQDVTGDYIRVDCSAFDILANRFQGVGVLDPSTTRLLPVEEQPVTGAPIPRYVSAERLVAVAVRELLYSILVEILLDALASEHGARLLATQAAEQWLDEHMTGLRRRLSAARREASTQEVIEIATGAHARQMSWAAGPHLGRTGDAPGHRK